MKGICRQRSFHRRSSSYPAASIRSSGISIRRRRMAEDREVIAIKPVIRRISPTGKDEGGKRKTAAYARVSTDSDEQQNSYQAQIDYYQKLISSDSKLELVKIYTDSGISGTSTRHRKGFNSMIADAL